MSDAVPVFTTPSPRVRQIPVDRPWQWLAAGWQDFLSAPGPSLTFGLIIVAISLALATAVLASGFIYLLLPLAAGFFFVAPVLAVGVYEFSRCRANGWVPTVPQALMAWRRNPGQIALMGLMLMLVHLAWVRIATLLFALFFQGINPPLDGLINAMFFSSVSLVFLITGTLIGAVLATVAFAIGALAIPMLLDRDVNVFTAIATSCAAVRMNWLAMWLWAAVIVAFTALGLVTFFLGLAVMVPVLGHATWHAYKDVVE
jgi:uncharacterized membrane protein